jgi:hypothetical protein
MLVVFPVSALPNRELHRGTPEHSREEPLAENTSAPSVDNLVALLVAAWTDSLGVPVDRDSDFLALGGTSIVAVQIAESVVDRHPEYEGIDFVTLDLVLRSRSLLEMAEGLRRFMCERSDSA